VLLLGSHPSALRGPSTWAGSPTSQSSGGSGRPLPLTSGRPTP
jgi:hypothetical protein